MNIAYTLIEVAKFFSRIQTLQSKIESLKFTRNVIEFYSRKWKLIFRFPSELKFHKLGQFDQKSSDNNLF